MLRRELDDEWGAGWRVLEREAQTSMVAHLYEKQEMRAAHLQGDAAGGF